MWPMDPDGEMTARERETRATKDIGMGHTLATKLYFVKSL
jgi:hypothetical protein